MHGISLTILTTILLWEGGAPGDPPTPPEHQPLLYLSQPTADIVSGSAVIVCPGGGYDHLAMDHEGAQIAEWLNSMGVTAFVLRYRQGGTGHRHPVPMQDGQRAIRLVRARAAEWGIDPKKIGVLGFSAGGHLASTLGTHFDSGDSHAADPIDRVSSRPDFLVLCYPVITMRESYMHRGSRRNLLGPEPAEALVNDLSNDLQVSDQTPPTFLYHTDEDASVPPENSVAFYMALRAAGVPAELHVFRTGGHGKGLAAELPGTRAWPDLCRAWLESHGLVNAAE